jgi:FlaA1/EpsC-like NDP-sugar epimerase
MVFSLWVVLYRLIVKQAEHYFNEKSDVKLIRVHGTDANAISAKALKLETPSRFKIVGFVDKKTQNESKRMLDLPILVLKKSCRPLCGLLVLKVLL